MSKNWSVSYSPLHPESFRHYLIDPVSHCSEIAWVLSGSEYVTIFSRRCHQAPSCLSDITVCFRGNGFHHSTLHPIWGIGASCRPKRGTSLSLYIWLLRQHGCPMPLAAFPILVLIQSSIRIRIRTGKLRWLLYFFSSSLFVTKCHIPASRAKTRVN